jgi:hypothetical protein
MSTDISNGGFHGYTERDLLCIIRVQAIARKWVARHHFLMVRKFIIKIQAIVRAWLAAKRLLQAVRLNARRTRIFLEIISIEKAYVQDLFSIVNDFKYPLLNKHILLPADAVKIFSNIESIYDIHHSLLDSLKTQRRTWSFKSGVGVCFLNELHKLEAYQNYIINFDEAAEALKGQKANNHHMTKFLKGVEGSSKMRHLELSDMLIQPVQRIPRYLLLLKEYMKFTPPNHADFELVPKILAHLNKILTNINSQKRKSLNESKSRFLVQEVSGANLVGLTDYSMEGELVRTHVHFPKKVYVFLFEEMFIMAKHSTPEKSDTPVMTGLHSRLSRMVHAKTYRFKLRKAIKIRSIVDISADETDNEARTFIMKIAHEQKLKQIERQKSELVIGGSLLNETPRSPPNTNDVPVYKVYHFKAPSEKAQMNWIASIAKLMHKVQR